MTRELDDLEQIADQTSFSFNRGHRKSGRGARDGHWTISPALERAQAPRLPKNESTATPSPPAAIPKQTDPPSPVLPWVVTNKEELLDLLRARRDELKLTHETLDLIVGWSGGYASKVLSPEPLKNFSERSLALILQALGLGIVRVEFAEDPAQVARMRGRWTPRRRPKHKPRRTRTQLRTAGTLLADPSGPMLASTSTNRKER